MSTNAALTALDRVSLNKAAVDSGFDVAEGEEHVGWLCYRSTSSPVRVALGVRNERPVGALSSEAVLGELRISPRPAIPSPDGFEGVFEAASFNELQEILTRAYVLGRTLPDQLYRSWQAAVAQAGPTEREATVRQRIGQDFFRRGLLALWDGRCAITGLAIPELLRASHAKPWKDSTDIERLDVYNGLLLSANLDAAFDAGFICVQSDGLITVTDRLDESARDLLGLQTHSRITQLSPHHQKYLEWHRRFVFDQ